jgi:hypothetical protein
MTTLWTETDIAVASESSLVGCAFADYAIVDNTTTCGCNIPEDGIFIANVEGDVNITVLGAN